MACANCHAAFAPPDDWDLTICPACAGRVALRRAPAAAEPEPSRHRCKKCPAEFALPRRGALAACPECGAREWVLPAVIVATTPQVDGFRAAATLGIVSAEAVLGVNVLSEILITLTDTFGGRSGQLQTALKRLKELCLASLEDEAAALGANGVVGATLSFQPIPRGATTMLMAVASGTAVLLVRDGA